MSENKLKLWLNSVPWKSSTKAKVKHQSMKINLKAMNHQVNVITVDSPCIIR